MQNIHMKKLSMPSLHWLQKIQRNQILQFPRLLPKQAVQDRPFIKNILKIYIEIIYVFLTIFLYLLKCPQSLIL